MKLVKGLEELYELYMKAINNNQEYLDENNVVGNHPVNVTEFIYTFNSIILR